MSTLVAVLSFLLAFGSAFPAYARAVGVAGPSAHSCTCETRGGHAHCACPLCFPEMNDVETFGAPTVIGRCGTNDPSSAGVTLPAILPSTFVLVAPDGTWLPRPRLASCRSQWSPRPELPPPRALA